MVLSHEPSSLGDGDSHPIIQEDVSLCLPTAIEGCQEREVVGPAGSRGESRVLHWDH